MMLEVGLGWQGAREADTNAILPRQADVHMGAVTAASGYKETS